jgi:thiamine-phosphate diphosphorylase
MPARQGAAINEMIRYYVTDRTRGDVIDYAARVIRDGIDMIQIREKDLAARELVELASKIRDLASGTKTRVLINDRLDIALAAGIDGVHLPGNGLPAGRVRPLVKVLGVSVHSIEEALQAERARADFVVFGPIFDSPGKTPVGLEPLRQVVGSVKIPVLAIGGITIENSVEVMQAGASGIAGIRLFQTK